MTTSMTPIHALPPTFGLLPLGAVRPMGWMLAQLNRDLDRGFASQLDRLTDHAARDLFAQRIESSSQQEAWWDSETRGNWLWGYTMMALLADAPVHRERVIGLLRDLMRTQDDDGYLGIYAPHARYQHQAGENGELWAQSRALLALLAAYELTNDASFLRCVEAAAKLTMQHYGPDKPYYRVTADHHANLTGLTHGLCYIDVMEWLFEITGDASYRDFGIWLFEDFSRISVPFANDDLSPINLRDPHRPFSGHAVHTAEHLRVLAWAYAMTGRAEWGEAWHAALTKLGRYTLPSGALLGDEGIHGFPAPEIGYEYCTTTELLLSYSSQLQKFGDVAVADRIERLAFNAAQGARLPDGTGVAYLSQDTRLDVRATRPDSYSYLHGLAGRFKYSCTHEDIACCCNPNAVRLLPHYISHMWMQLGDRDGIAAILYGPCLVKTTIAGVAVEIEMQTRYPFDDEVELIVRAASPLTFRLQLRKPCWVISMPIEAPAGTTILTLASEGADEGWITLDRQWGVDDHVRVTITSAIETVAYPQGDVAILRGPLQFVQPIDARLQPIKTYPVENLYDLEAHPVDLIHAHTPLILDGTLPDLGFALRHRTTPDPDHPWADPPIELGHGTQTLWPMGSTILRRAAFPMIG